MSDVEVKFRGKLTGLPSIKIQMMTMKSKYRIKKQKQRKISPGDRRAKLVLNR
jgi:hypothetical protein